MFKSQAKLNKTTKLWPIPGCTWTQSVLAWPVVVKTTLPLPRCKFHVFVASSSHPVFWACRSRSPARHSMATNIYIYIYIYIYIISKAKWHDNATLHNSQSYRPCCIDGLDPGNVSNSNSMFHVLWFSSSSESHVSLLLAMYSYGSRHIMLLFERRRCQWIVIRWDCPCDHPFLCFLHLIIASILALHAARSCATFTHSVPTHCDTACSHLHTTSMTLRALFFLQIPQPLHVFQSEDATRFTLWVHFLSHAPHDRTTKSSL